MLRIVFCSLILSIILQFSIAQAVESFNDLSTFIRDQKINPKKDETTKQTEIAGNPYLKDIFLKGAVIMQNGKKYRGIPMRLNVYLDEMEYKDENNHIWAINNPEMLKYIELDKDRLVYRSFVFNKKYSKGYFILLEEGNINLLRKPQITVLKAKEEGAYQDAQPPKYARRPDIHFIQLKYQGAFPIFSKKDLLTLFPDKQEEISAFIKKNKVKINKPETLLKLVQYYNSISEPIK